jgi:peroxiredoxin Q/BCP
MPSIKGARVVGISPDDEKSHRKFISKHNLNFTLLVDEDHALAEKLGLWVEKTLYGKKYMGVERTTYLLDANGVVEKVWQKVNPKGHAAEVQAALT